MQGRTTAASSGVDLLFVSEPSGSWFPRRCKDDSATDRNNLADIAAMLRAAREHSGASLVVGGGALLGIGNIERFLMKDEDGSRQAARILKKVGIEVFGLGMMELGLSNENLFTYLDEAQKEGLAAVATNLRCDSGKKELCKSLVQQHKITRGGLRIGVLSLLPEITTQWAGPEHMHAAKLEAYKSVLASAQSLRKEVDALVLLLDSLEMNLQSAVEVARLFEGQGVHLDVMYVTRLDSQHGGVNTVSLTSGTLIVGSMGAASGVTRVRLILSSPKPAETPAAKSATERAVAALPSAPDRSPTLSATAARLTARVPAPAELATELAEVQSRMCQTWGRPVASLPTKGLQREQVMSVMLSALREAAQAEVAVLPQENIFDGGLPLLAASGADIGRLLPFSGSHQG